MTTITLSAVIHREDDWLVAECPEIGTASQGRTVEEILANLREATELFLEENPDAATGNPAFLTTFSIQLPMPRLPRVGSRKVIAALERLGFTSVRTKGSHLVCVVPLHDDIAAGKLRSVLRQAEVDPDAFIRVL